MTVGPRFAISGSAHRLWQIAKPRTVSPGEADSGGVRRVVAGIPARKRENGKDAARTAGQSRKPRSREPQAVLRMLDLLLMS